MDVTRDTSMTDEEQASVHRDVAVQAQKVGDSAKHLERSASAVKHATHELSDSADRRTQLAADRTILAAERTYAAWVRTGLASLASGIGARALLRDLLPAWFGQITGSVLVAFSVFCFIAAVCREMRPGAPPPQPDTRQLPAFLLIVMNGFLALVGLAVLGALWFGR
jgi:putative membrane protein